MNGRSQLYITLPSNVKVGGSGANNTIGNYKTTLPERLILSDDWEVGVVSVLYPRSWHNITQGVLTYKTLAEPDPVFITLPPGYYGSVTEILSLINKQLTGTSFKLTYSSDTGKVTVKASAVGDQLQLYPDLAYALGFEVYPAFTTGSRESKFPCSLDGGVNSLFIYADIVEASVVGDTYAQILQIAPVKGKFGESPKIEFTPIVYLPMRTHDISSIKIDIATDSGKDLFFSSGKVIIQLHFRRRGLFH